VKKIPEVRHSEARFRHPEEEDYTILPNAVLFGFPGLSAGARWLYALLRSYAWGLKAYCYPTIGGLANTQGVSEDTIRRRLRELTNTGLINIETQQGYRNIYWLERVPKTPGKDARGRTNAGGQDLNKQVVKELKTNENDSLSLAIDIAEAHGHGKQDRKALTTSLSKYPALVLERAQETLEKRVAEGDVENPGAYANRLAAVFARAEEEAEADREEERADLFHTILSTAAFEHRDGWTAERLREALLRYWPAELELIEKAVELVIR